ncbi:MAG: sodium:proton antiporter, partial [Clostridia bacterium]|nr:sodium:proton antiporter [Clostridia bacterium]
MLWWQNLPFFSIMLCIFSAAVCAVLPRRAARLWAPSVTGAILVMSVLLAAHVRSSGSFVFTMGHFTAPWGNEIRAGLLEAVTACVFFAVMLLSVIAGGEHLSEDIMPDKQSLYAVTLCLTGASLLVMIYTNDLFTAYVFLEIMTLGACS